MNVFRNFLWVVVAHAALVSSKCFAHTGSIILEATSIESFDCSLNLTENDLSRAFVTHSWHGEFASSPGYAVMASLKLSSTTTNTGCVRIFRTAGMGRVWVDWFVVVCRGGEIKNVWRGDLNYTQNYKFDGNYSSLVGTAVNVSNNSLILGSFSIGAGMYFSRDDLACVEFTPRQVAMATDSNKNFSVRFAFSSPTAGELSQAAAHVQVVDWNSAAASLLSGANQSAIPFVTVCGVGLATTSDINFAEAAAVFNRSDRSIGLDPLYVSFSNFSLASQFLRFADNVASVFIDTVTMNASQTVSQFRNITTATPNVWLVILGTSNMLGVPASSATSIMDVAVSVGRVGSQLFVRRTMSNVTLTVHVATIDFFDNDRPNPISLSGATPATTGPDTSSTTHPISPMSTTSYSYESSATMSTTSYEPSTKIPTSSTPLITMIGSSSANAETPAYTEMALAIDPVIVGGAAGGGAALLIIVSLLVGCCALKARKSKRATTTQQLPLSQLNVNMSSVRNEQSTYADIGDVRMRTSGQLYSDVGGVQQQQSYCYSDVDAVRNQF